MTYGFVDTSEEGNDLLPAEALKLNGAYIEDQIPGYKTLYVTGREALTPEVKATSYEARDGSFITRRRYPARTITIGYQLIADSNEDFRAKYNKLAHVLDVEDAQLIFHDEEDKYFTGTVSEIGNVSSGTNAVTGEFTFLCVDPLKYSVEEYTVTAENKAFSFDYGGTAPARPKITATFADTLNGDSGFLAFFDASGHTIQLGNPDEADGVDYPSCQRLMYDETFASWTPNNEIYTRTESVYHSGTVSTNVSGYKNWKVCKVLPDGWDLNTPENYYVTGPSLVTDIPADSSGDKNCTNFLFEVDPVLQMSNEWDAQSTNRGWQRAFVLDADNKPICGYELGIDMNTGKAAQLDCYVGDYVIGMMGFDASYSKSDFLNNYCVYILKAGNTFTFRFRGKGYTYKVSDDDAKRVASKIVIEFYEWWGPYNYAYTQPEHNEINRVIFTRHDCETWEDVPNKFQPNDVVSVDCNSAKITFNGAECPDLGALGNNWEDFLINPGANTIGAACSAFTEVMPTLELTYREAFY
jgi:predicted phage tail component-like protein